MVRFPGKELFFAYRYGDSVALVVMHTPTENKVGVESYESLERLYGDARPWEELFRYAHDEKENHIPPYGSAGVHVLEGWIEREAWKGRVDEVEFQIQQDTIHWSRLDLGNESRQQYFLVGPADSQGLTNFCFQGALIKLILYHAKACSYMDQINCAVDEINSHPDLKEIHENKREVTRGDIVRKWWGRINAQQKTMETAVETLESSGMIE